MLTQKILTIAHTADEFILWLLLILSVISIGVIIEKFFSLKKITNASKKIQNHINIMIQSYSPDDVEALSKDHSSMEGRALSYGLRHLKANGLKGLEEVFNSFILNEKPKLEKYLSFLATVGSTAPFIGLFGTVLGIMKAFNDLAVAENAGQQTVMAGISIALVATAIGLFVAIPAVIAYNHYQKQVKNVIQNIECVKELCLAYAKNKGS